ncbi:MAG: hypothetical protein FJ279_16015, partial [Planctomycetes bacterium]|nr:hypothetical protein [Planctomycetota bacterium]
MKPRSFLTLSALLLLLHAAPAQPQPQEALKLVTGLETAEGLKKTYATNLTSSALEANPDARYVSEGKASLKLSATASAAEGNQYLGAMIPVKLFDVAARSLLLDVWTSTPERTQALYVRLYDDAGKVIGSWNNWGLALKAHEKATVRLQRDISRGGFSYESKLITSASTTVHRIEVITGTRDKNVPFDLYVDNIRTSDRVYGSIVKLDKVKPLCLMTKLLEAAVVVPPELKESAAGLLANPPLAGNKPAIWPPTLPLDSSTHWLLIGNLNNNPAFLRFYSHSCGQADAVFPGEGGYLIHTVHDPFGTGKNVVLVGATDAAGAKRGCDELAAMLGAKPELGHAIKVAPSEDVRKRFGSLFREPSEPDIEKAAAGARSAMDGGGARGIVSTAAASGLNYSRTGLLGWAKRFKAMLFAYEDWVRDPKRIHGAHDGKWGMDVDFLTYELIPAWDIVEESGVFSDAERLRITRFLAEFVQEDTARQARSVLGNKRTRFNHQSFPALGCYYAGEYFKRNYSVAEADDWLEIADQCFQVQARYFKPYEDSNGYQWLVPWHTMQYAFARPDPTMFDLGAARKLADLSILTMDNLGYQSPFGDVGSCFGWNSDLILLAGARWHYRDGRYQWALDKRAAAGRTTGLGDFACTVAPQEPKDLLGVRSWPLEPSAYDLFKSKGKVGFDKTFDKVCFRSSFEPDKPYLLLDGVARAGHDHYDSNAFVRFTARNRLWLEDGDYIKSLPKFHNTLLVFRDGQSEKPSAFCELEHLADFTRVGFSETSLKDYAGVDWHRNVVWKKEGWFAVLDRVVARQDGDYSLRCQWRAMGAPTLAAQSFLVEQQGESLRIENADGSRLMLKEDAETGKNWGGYKLAEPVVRVLSQVTDRRLKSGEKHAFLNVLRVSPTDDAGDLKVRKLSDTCVEVTSDGQVALLGVGKSEMTDAALFFVDADGLALVGATQFAAGSFRLSADKPVDLEFDNKSGNGVAVASAATTLRVGDEAFAFPAAGKHEFQLKQGHAPFYALASLHPVAPDPKQPFVAPTTHLPTTPPPQNTSLLWRYRKEFDTYLLTNNRG